MKFFNNKEKTKKTVTEIFDSVPEKLPSLKKAQTMFAKTKSQTAWWSNSDEIFLKLQEEISELKLEIKTMNKEKAMAELGDVLMILTSIAVEEGLDIENAARQGLNKVVTRLKMTEKFLHDDGLSFNNSTPEEREERWQKAKIILKDS